MVWIFHPADSYILILPFLLLILYYVFGDLEKHMKTLNKKGTKYEFFPRLIKRLCIVLFILSTVAFTALIYKIVS